VRRRLGLVLRVLLLVVGAVLLVVGALASVLIGPDDTAWTGPHDLRTDGVAVVTEPEAIRYVGPVLHLTVESADGPVFVGVAHEADAESYLDDQTRLVVSRLRLPWTPTTDERGSGSDALAPPGQQPWWITSASGEGAQELEWPLPHGRYVLVALAADGSAGVDVAVTLGLEVEGAFYAALAVTALGLALVLLAVWLTLRARRRGRAATETEVAA
jgi:hypothetical protein